MARWAMACPSVARRSPAMTTPSAKRSATTVVAWRTGPRSPVAVSGSSPPRRRSLAKSGPGSSVGWKMGRDRLLATLLDVVADELLGVVLEDLVDLVHEV